MKQPWWKIWLSYFWEWPVETISSEHHEFLQVLLVQGQYQLVSPNAIYSYGELYTNFLNAFKQMNMADWKGQKTLVLGLGLGSIPLILEKRFGLLLDYTIVEFDEAVIHLAEKYTLQHLRSPVEVIQADALLFTQLCRDTFDLICMDIFLDDVIPTAFETAAFLENLKAMLAPGGLLLYNRLALNPTDREKSRYFFETTFKEVFPEGKKMDVGRNWMLTN